MNKVIFYTSNFCGYCSAARSMLIRKGISFEEINVSSDPAIRVEILNKWNWHTVPLLIINDKLIGGYTEMINLDSNYKLDKFFN